MFFAIQKPGSAIITVMKLTRDDILKLAKLSRLKIDEAEVATFQAELSEILEYVAQLDNVDVQGVLPTYQVTGLTSQDQNAAREDEITEQVSQAELFKNLPQTEDQQIKVQRMIG